MRTFDSIVLGSGIAGLSFALRAAEHGRVALVTKRALADSNTAWAQGGLACVISREDSFDLHIRDTLAAGDGLCDEEIVRGVVTEGPERVKELIKLGVRFDERLAPNGEWELDLGREGGHSKRRVLHSHDATGQEIERALVEAVQAHPSIEVLEHHMAVDFLTTGKLGFAMQNSCVGVYVLDCRTGEVEVLRSDVNVLATGGCGKVYLYTTNPGIATGDGVAMAWRAGAVISNMEFIQFPPPCLYHPEVRSFLISEAVRGEGGLLLDERGRRFMENAHPLRELAPRDVVARAIDAEMKRSGSRCVFLDISHKPADFIISRFPTIHEKCLSLGIDITRQPIPVVPAAHYQCGGVKTDANGETSLRGLFAIGEVASTGLHGANRLASNSLLEGAVFAKRAADKAFRNRPPPQNLDLPEWRPGQVTDVDELVVIYHNWDEIRRLMWDYVGIVRTDKRLQRAAARLRNLHAEIQEFYWNFKVSRDLLELRNLVTVAALIVDCALSRKESRGLHFTLDYPERDDSKFRRETTMRRI
ncbi:MAG: L-aspartate oxidase [Terrimicrobiaceae bacterium]|nr:L-aspartate oxidase [Terrimicrobiaceae bacterium]